MAGRRKKKERPSNAMESYKPALVFTESPVHGRKFYSTPVQAARRPFLAPSVPADQEASKWVSPQFDSTMCACSSPYLQPSRRQQKGKRRKPKENEAPANKQVIAKSSLPALTFLNGNQNTGNDQGTQRRHSQRIQAKEKKTHFLFKETESRTPTKIREMKVLAYETPEHLMPQGKTSPLQLWTNHDRCKEKKL